MSLNSAFLARIRSYGIDLKQKWIDLMLQEGVTSPNDLFKRFLETDIAQTSEPYPLLENILAAKQILDQDLLVQVDEVVDISLPREDRLNLLASPKGTLKFLLNSGGYQFIGLSKTKMKSLSPTTQPGTKILIKAPIEVRYCVFFLIESRMEVLGGFSEEKIKKMKDFYEGAKRGNRPKLAETTQQQPNSVSKPPAPQNPRANDPPPIINRSALNKETVPPAGIPSLRPNVPAPAPTPRASTQNKRPSPKKPIYLDISDSSFSLSDDDDVTYSGPPTSQATRKYHEID